MPTNANSKPVATITEKELFRHFLRMQIKRSSSFGGILQEYQPEEYLRDCGSYGGIEDFTYRLADELEEDDSPEDTLDCTISDLRCYLANLELVRSDFQAFKTVHVIMPNEPDWRDTAANEAEEDPRYHPVGVSDEVEAA